MPKNIKMIEGIFEKSLDGDEAIWAIYEDRLLNLTSEEFVNEISDEIDKMFEYRPNSFKAQILEISGKNVIGTEYKYYVVSLGHDIYSYHYTFQPFNDSWYVNVINQEFYRDVVEPFQRSLGI